MAFIPVFLFESLSPDVTFNIKDLVDTIVIQVVSALAKVSQLLKDVLLKL